MHLVNCILRRNLSLSTVRYGKKNFRKFPLYNKRGTRIFKQQQMENPDPEVPIDKRGVRDVGYKIDGKFVPIPEMIPDIIVPDLKDFKLKPYVSYRAPDVVQSEFTAKDLFEVVYAAKIHNDFKEGKLNNDGSPVEPSFEEALTSDDALRRAKQTGSDIFLPPTKSAD